MQDMSDDLIRQQELENAQADATQKSVLVTEHEKAVRAYTLRPAGIRSSTLANSLAHCPTLTATTAPSRLAFTMPAVCSATYPRSSSCRCCGSIVTASAAETEKKW